MTRLRVPESLQAIVKHDEPLWRHTSMRVGGPACVFAEPRTIEELAAFMKWASAQAVPTYVLGAGTNVIFGDRGFHGAVIAMSSGPMQLEERAGLISVSAATPLSRVAWEMARRGLSGLEFACGIPGSVGGGVVMNAGTKHGEVGDTLVHVLAQGPEHPEPDIVSTAQLELGYRTSSLRGRRGRIAIRAAFRLESTDPDKCLARARHWVKERSERLPTGASSGCIFRNPSPEMPAGRLIDEAGCKGLRVGSARVTDCHANFILNEGTNNASEVLSLIDRVKREVNARFGIELTEEVEIVE